MHDNKWKQQVLTRCQKMRWKIKQIHNITIDDSTTTKVTQNDITLTPSNAKDDKCGTKWRCIDNTTGLNILIENLVCEGNQIYIRKINKIELSIGQVYSNRRACTRLSKWTTNKADSTWIRGVGKTAQKEQHTKTERTRKKNVQDDEFFFLMRFVAYNSVTHINVRSGSSDLTSQVNTRHSLSLILEYLWKINNKNT